jgi:hypothetical protein
VLDQASRFFAPLRKGSMLFFGMLANNSMQRAALSAAADAER